MIWKWTVEGTGSGTGSPGAMRHGFNESGLCEAEHAAEVFIWLPTRSDVWELLDAKEPITITVELAPDDSEITGVIPVETSAAEALMALNDQQSPPFGPVTLRSGRS